ncbi:Nitroreductase [Paenibacillus sp. UNCCL117]|uniref:nitroreductase family protein n=1 Tax=unclassified Paenibacillus TaxID=185978 RepID=UPI000881ADC0|nr:MULTISPECIES: nitroreductase [unclassified Paenibacillus]SDC71764.1 Nitroreductase [Paenibacillus sp. cl123]SFW24568.1 Nitroreductase [Paenibacillus sp. UNCCL117]
MELFEAIRTRRTIGRVKDEPVNSRLIEQILDAGNWAPSHHATEPWRFYVMTGGGRNKLGDAYAAIAAETADGELTEEALSKHRGKALRSPVIIAVAVSPSPEKGVIRIEEFAAAHAAAQNMLLAAHALGLGAIWRSGEPMYHPLMQQAFGLAEGEELVALLYIGHPAMSPPEGKRRPAAEKTVWLAD